MSRILQYLEWLSIPKIRVIDFLEIVILAFLVYQILRWIKNTRTWTLMQGFIVLFGFLIIAWLFQMDTILWLAKNMFSVGIISVIILFQPEIRRALEQLGQKNLLGSLFSAESEKKELDKFNERTIHEIVKATYEMGKVKTGALIVIEHNTPLREYERTGIMLDSIVSSQLLINIFEHNTPLHDGAVIIKDSRITAATCYLPLSDNMELSKELGTRHRAGIGISEVTDCVVIIVSEETGGVSFSRGGILYKGIEADVLKQNLLKLLEKNGETKGLIKWKGRRKNEKNAGE